MTAAIPRPTQANPISAGTTPPLSRASASPAPASALPTRTIRPSPQRLRQPSAKTRASTIITETTAIPMGASSADALATSFM